MPTRLRLRAPPLCVLLHYFLFHNKCQVEGTQTTTLLPSRRLLTRNICGIGRGAIAFPQQSFRGIHGVGHLAITFSFSRAIVD